MLKLFANYVSGSFQVCKKWIKDRKCRTLDYSDIRHYQRGGCPEAFEWQGSE